MSAGPSAQSWRRILVYRFGQIGDTIAALPSLWQLRAAFPEAKLTLLSEVPRGARFLAPEAVLPPGGELIQDYLKYAGGASPRSWLSLAGTVREIRRRKFDALVYLLPTMRSPQQRARDLRLFRLIGIRNILGAEGFPAEPFPRAENGGLGRVGWEADALLQRLARSGMPEVAAGQGCMDLRITAQEKAKVREWWSRQPGAGGGVERWFAVCSGSKWSSKQWPWDRFREVGARLIQDHGLVPVVLGGADERASGEDLVRAWGQGYCAAGELSVRESAALLGDAVFYLGNDTGVMHLAAAMGRPCVAIFSALDWPGRWHPYGSGHRVLRHEVPCAGCLSQECRFANECLTGISAGEVYRACEAVLREMTSPGLPEAKL